VKKEELEKVKSESTNHPFLLRLSSSNWATKLAVVAAAAVVVVVVVVVVEVVVFKGKRRRKRRKRREKKKRKRVRVSAIFLVTPSVFP